MNTKKTFTALLSALLLASCSTPQPEPLTRRAEAVPQPIENDLNPLTLLP